MKRPDWLKKDALRLFCLLAVALLAVAGSESALAQVSASISGKIEDQSGAVIGGATVTVTSLETGMARVRNIIERLVMGGS